MRTIIGCSASFALAFSLFAMPAMAAAEPLSDEDQAFFDQGENSTQVQNQNASDAHGSAVDPGSAESSDSSESDGYVGEDVLLENMPETDEGDHEGSEDEEGEPSIFDSFFQFLSSLSPFSVTGEDMHDASIKVTLTSLVPTAMQAAGNDLTLKLIGTSGGESYDAKFVSKTTTYENFITDVHGSDGTARVNVNTPMEFSAEIHQIPAGSYRVEVAGSYYGTYKHGAEITLRDGDMANFSLVDSMYDNPIPADDKTIGLVPYGDFNGDGKVDDVDSALIADAVHKGLTDSIYDFTGDGKVDLADVQHFANTVNKTHAASKVRITKDVSQMDSSFNEGTSAGVKPGGTGSAGTNPDKASNSMFYDDGDTIELKHQTGANITEDAPVGFTVDSKGVAVEAFEIQFPRDENNKPYFMGDSGKVVLDLDDPVPSGSDLDKVYELTAPIEVATGNIADLGNPNPDDDHPYDFMFQRVKAYLFAETGQLVVVFAKSVAPVKLRSVEVTFTSTTNPTNKTIEISHLEFLEHAADLNLPVFPDAPEVTEVQTGDESIALAWTDVPDAVAYDVEVGINNQTDVYTTSTPTLSIAEHSSTGNLVNDAAYQVRVRAIGLKGNSVWSEPVAATPEDRTAPSGIAAPNLVAGYSQITASWPALENTDSYTLYFKKVGAESFSSAELQATSYTVKNLDSYSEYEFYLVAENDYGISEASQVVRASTTSAFGKIPWFNLINRTSQNSDLYPAVNSFSSVTIDGIDDESAQAVVDGNFDSYVKLGDASELTGGTNATVSATLKDVQSIRNLAITTYLGEGFADEIEDVFVRAFGTTHDGSEYTSELFTLESGLQLHRVATEGDADTESVNTLYVELPYTLDGVQTVHVSFTRADGRSATMSELALYAPSGIEDALEGIWADERHITLREGMDDAAFDELAKQIEATDEASGENGHPCEKHPLVGEFRSALDAARQMLDFDDPISTEVDTSITATHANVGGVNAWQPLGIAAKAGETVKVYVSTPSGATGEATKLRLIASQYRGDKDSQFAPVGYLMSGMNELTIPEIGERIEGCNAERGGALYLEYTGDSTDDAYQVSVLGGTKIPVLDLTGLSDGDSKLRSERIMQYTMQLEEYVNTLSQVHAKAGHVGTGFFGMFVDTDCFANMTEIITDHAILTLPATEIVLKLGSTDMSAVADRIAAVTRTTDAMFDLAYQHKGLFSVEQNPNLTSRFGAHNDQTHARHNIRCMSMPQDESVCSTSSYLGIPWDAVGDLLKVEEISVEEDGAYRSGGYLGLTVAHALGHQLSDNAGAIPEVSANYFTQLLTSRDTNESAVFDWNDVFDRVSAGTKGALDAKLGAAALWQLHLAYDAGYSHTVYVDPDDQMEHLIFARMNAYARNVGKAPYGLSLDGADDENRFMRLACAAANRDLTGFFKAWGMECDEGTVAYASNFKKEQRQIQYLTDESCRAAKANAQECDVESVSIVADIHFDGEAQNVVIDNIAARGDGVALDSIHGFEVLRTVSVDHASTADGYEAVGFIQGTDAGAAVFTEAAVVLPEDEVEYHLRAIADNGALSPLSDALTVRVEHAAAKGGVANFTMPTDKSKWEITSNMVSTDKAAALEFDVFDTLGCAGDPPADLSAIADGDKQTHFIGEVAQESMKQQVTIAFNDMLEVSGIRYYPSFKEKSFKGIDVEVSQNGKDWTLVNTSMLYFPATDTYKGYNAFGHSDNAVIYFSEADVTGDPAQKDKLATYHASYLRLTEWCENSDPVAIAEIDVLSSPIYRVSLKGEDAHFGMGKLTDEVTLEMPASDDAETISGASAGRSGDSAVHIPKGSFVIMGDYAGNPVYNTVVIKDQDGNVLVDPSKQIIITNKAGEKDAAVVESAALVRNGTWLYYFEPGTYEDLLEGWGEIHPELYRVDESSSLVGAKLVSVGAGAKVQRQGINDDMNVDLYGITLDLGAYEIYR